MDYHQYFCNIAQVWTSYFNGKISRKERDETLDFYRRQLSEHRAK
jgi:hypothetical protein